VDDEQVELSKLIDVLNERFGTQFKPADELFFEQVREEAIADEGLQEAARANTMDNFRFVFERALEGLFIDRMDQNEDLFTRFMDNPDFRATVTRVLLERVYQQIRETPPEASSTP